MAAPSSRSNKKRCRTPRCPKPIRKGTSKIKWLEGRRFGATNVEYWWRGWVCQNALLGVHSPRPCPRAPAPPVLIPVPRVLRNPPERRKTPTIEVAGRPSLIPVTHGPHPLGGFFALKREPT